MSVWWPVITRDIKHVVGACEHCRVHKPSQQREPPMTTLLPTRPWQRVAVDLCLPQGNDYTVVVDYYSRWIEILRLSYTNAACIAKLKDIIARLGISNELVSDNAPQFSSSEFKSFADQYGFTHVTSSPYLPNVYGEAERAVETATRIFKQDDSWQGLMVSLPEDAVMHN